MMSEQKLTTEDTEKGDSPQTPPNRMAGRRRGRGAKLARKLLSYRDSDGEIRSQKEFSSDR
jgi:hypothetical protein